MNPTVRRSMVCAAAVGAAIAVIVVHRDNLVLAAGLVAATVVLAVLADIDLAEHRLPNKIVGPFALAAAGAVMVAGVASSDIERSVVSIGVGIAFVVALLTMNVVGGIGMGDVKLSLPIGIVAGWLGVDAVLATVFVTAVVGAVAGVALLLVTRADTGTRFSYGPAMAVGAVAGMLVAS